jgi:O-antigen/teichoic acid export membrane protein
MAALLKRLVAGGAAYQAAAVLSALVALVTLPLYTRALTQADYGRAETLLVTIILASIVLRLGLGEALVRFSFERDPVAVARSVTGTVLVTTTVAALLALLAAGPLSELLLGTRDAVLLGFGVLGLWAFTNLEVAYALLRVQERRATYLRATLVNVGLTVALTLVLVLGFDAGARGYVAGNYVASAVVLLALWWTLRDRLGLTTAGLGDLVRFGLPTVPADATVFALNVVDRTYLLQTESEAAAGRYAVAVKLATAVIIAVRGFQLAWPPLAYSIADEGEARRFYARVTTWYVVVVGWAVVALALLGRWLVRTFTAPEWYGAHEALPWVALGWAGYGLFLVFSVLAGRAKVTLRVLPAAAAGLVVNVVVLVVLVPEVGIAGAGIALAAAYVVMVAALAALTRRALPVPFEGRRLAPAVAVLAGVAVAAELALPTDGAGGLLARGLAVLAVPALLGASGFLRPGERAALRALAGRALSLAPRPAAR